MSPCWLEVDFTSGAVLTEPIDIDEDEGELTIRSKLSSVELIEVLLLKWALSIESMLLLMDEQQLSSMVEECVRV